MGTDVRPRILDCWHGKHCLTQSLISRCILGQTKRDAKSERKALALGSDIECNLQYKRFFFEIGSVAKPWCTSG